MIKESINLNGPEKTRKNTLRSVLPLIVISIQKTYGIHSFQRY